MNEFILHALLQLFAIIANADGSDVSDEAGKVVRTYLAALLNKEHTEIYKTNYVIRSVYLEEGEHTIEFKFEPQSFEIGKLVSIITLISFISPSSFKNKKSCRIL